MTMSYNVTLKENASPEELEKAKDEAKKQGGNITNEFTLTPGFSVEFPADSVHTLKSNDHVDVEADKEVFTQ
ncbi:MAG: hypothetical protein M1816_006064 [Peltula sp. TS41687]|nr:MAG: hypothetical protein M1816_006064 [Peltula sp. TS41687]